MDTKQNKKSLNVGLMAHVDAGKTTLSEALLYLSGENIRHYTTKTAVRR